MRMGQARYLQALVLQLFQLGMHGPRRASSTISVGHILLGVPDKGHDDVAAHEAISHAIDERVAERVETLRGRLADALVQESCEPPAPILGAPVAGSRDQWKDAKTPGFPTLGDIVQKAASNECVMDGYHALRCCILQRLALTAGHGARAVPSSDSVVIRKA
jgi:hypothetical protein